MGPSRLIVDPAVIAVLDDLDFSPWHAEQRPDCFAITIILFCGSRLIRRQEPAAAPAQP